MSAHELLAGAEPFFRVLRGTPDDHELAALTAVLLIRLRRQAEAGDGADPALPPARWNPTGYAAPGSWARRT
ncbi:MAG TPA: acyl-CoA carboxylase subunit epsilon [Actinocrinis sp.]